MYKCVREERAHCDNAPAYVLAILLRLSAVAGRVFVYFDSRFFYF